jgi:Flp pilus assembly protein TadD
VTTTRRELRLAPLLPLALLVILAATPARGRNMANLRLDRARLAAEPGATLLTEEEFSGDLRRMGLVAFLRGDTVEALSYWQKDPQAALFLMGQGAAATIAGELDQAVTWYDLAVALRPDGAKIRYYRGVAYEHAGRTDLALSDYESADRLAEQEGLSTYWQAHIAFEHGRLLFNDGRWGDSVQAFQRAVALESDSPGYYLALGDALFQLGDLEAAGEAYRMAEQEG